MPHSDLSLRLVSVVTKHNKWSRGFKVIQLNPHRPILRVAVHQTLSCLSRNCCLWLRDEQKFDPNIVNKTLLQPRKHSLEHFLLLIYDTLPSNIVQAHGNVWKSDLIEAVLCPCREVQKSINILILSIDKPVDIYSTSLSAAWFDRKKCTSRCRVIRKWCWSGFKTDVFD